MHVLNPIDLVFKNEPPFHITMWAQTHISGPLAGQVDLVMKVGDREARVSTTPEIFTNVVPDVWADVVLKSAFSELAQESIFYRGSRYEVDDFRTGERGSIEDVQRDLEIKGVIPINTQWMEIESKGIPFTKMVLTSPIFPDIKTEATILPCTFLEDYLQEVAVGVVEFYDCVLKHIRG